MTQKDNVKRMKGNCKGIRWRKKTTLKDKRQLQRCSMTQKDNIQVQKDKRQLQSCSMMQKDDAEGQKTIAKVFNDAWIRTKDNRQRTKFSKKINNAHCTNTECHYAVRVIPCTEVLQIIRSCTGQGKALPTLSIALLRSNLLGEVRRGP